MFEKAVELEENSSNYYWLGQAYGLKALESNPLTRISLAKKVKNAFEKAIELDSLNVSARLKLMQYYLEAPSIMGGSKEKAKVQAEKIKEIDILSGHQAYAMVYSVEKKNELAENEFKMAISLEPENKKLYYDLFNWYHGLKKYDEAIFILEELLQKYPDDQDVIFQIGYIYITSAQFDKAFAIFENILLHNSTAANAYYQIGRTSILSGQRLEQAEYCLKNI